jgi:ectoine hydroxylase-related dioxygenase (phytanoyl-CoA dioxygenase family)
VQPRGGEATTGGLPALLGERSVTDDLREGFRRDGHVFVPGVASADEIAAYRPTITSAADRYNTETRPLEQRSTYGKAFLQIMNLWTRDDGVRRFVFSPRFAKIAADLMGVEGVRLYHDQALYKEPGGGPTPFHQDMYYWPLDTDRTVTMWMPLVDVTEEMGSMTFVNGSHTMGYLGELPISDESEAVFRSFIAERGLTTRTYGAMRAGDATFHAGWTLHGAPGNPTATMREVMTVIYMAADARVSEPDNENRQLDLETWLPGLKPGDLAASPLNPVVWGG